MPKGLLRGTSGTAPLPKGLLREFLGLHPNAFHFSTVHYNTVHFNVPHFNTVHFNTVQFIARFSEELHSLASFFSVVFL